MSALKCTKCGCIYPYDMDNCPTCNTAKTSATTKTLPSKQCNNTYNRTREERKRDYLSHDKIFLVSCSACNKEISNQAEICPHCGQTTGIHICPKCKSSNTKVISGTSKAVSVALFGIFAANKVKSNFQCNKCGHKF